MILLAIIGALVSIFEFEMGMGMCLIALGVEMFAQGLEAHLGGAARTIHYVGIAFGLLLACGALVVAFGIGALPLVLLGILFALA